MSLRPHHDPNTATPVRRSLAILPFSERQQALSRAGLPALTLLDALDRDHRPTFAIHSQPQIDTSQPPSHSLPELVYCNPALTAADDLLAKVVGKNSPSSSYASFLSWLVHDAATTHVFEGHIWSILAIDQPRVKIVSGVPNLGLRDGEELGSDNDGLDTGHERKRKRTKHELGGAPGNNHVSDDYSMEKRDRAQIFMEDGGPEGQQDAPYDVDWSKLKNVPLSAAPTRRSSYDGQAHSLLNLPPTPSPSVSSRSLTLLETTKFQRFAERADIAIYIIDPLTRRYTYRNQRWFDIFKVNLEDDDDDDVWKSWTRIVLPEDMAECEELFKRLAIDKQALSVEIKTNIPWQPPSSSPTSLSPSTPSPEHVKWILCSAYPELNQNADIVEIVGNVTDISKQKWAEGIQKQRVESALESKKHLELFIDSTSHEMRNPLSAIMQCADEIVSSFTDTHTQALQEAEREQTLDAAKTITQCAQHMKRIVDDILTISKLDSGLLVFTPIDAQPASVARHAVKMFEAEAKAANVNMNVVVDKSLRDENAEWVRFDTTRLLQVLINLITNAIKFTRLENTRHIILSVGASSSRQDGTSSEYSGEVGWLQDGQGQLKNEMDDHSKVREQIITPPILPFSNVQFIPSSLPPDANLEADWQLGDTVNIHFSVQDSGRGLSEEEQRNLFARFSQASPRTHINYGGSGLGLFISKRLCQMHGGQIGLSSQEGKGSTFSFYIKARRTTADSEARNNSPTLFPEDLGYKPSTEADVSGSRTPSQPPVLDADLQTLHVLIVEDNIVNQKVLAKQLRNLGHVVWTANHGGEALEFLEKTNAWKCDNGHDTFLNFSSDSHNLNPVNSVQEGRDTQCDSRKGEPGIDFTSTAPRVEPPQEGSLPLGLDLILLDWEMPVMDGITCVRKIRALQHPSSQNTFVSPSVDFSTNSLFTSAPRSPHVGGGTPWLIKHIPVIGVTANARKQQIDEALEAGMDDVVSKPFRVGELVDRMRGVLQRCTGSMRDGDGSRDNREGIRF